MDARSERWGGPAFLAAAAVSALLPLGVALTLPGTWIWLLLGGGAWVVGVFGLKYPLAARLGPVVARWPAVPAALAMGLLSAVTELGPVFAAFAYFGVPGPPAILAVGVGAGSVENVWLASQALGSGSGEVEPEPAPNEKTPLLSPDSGETPAAWVLVLGNPIERLLVAMPLHVGARALLAASLGPGGLAALAAALGFFTAVDGLPVIVERRGAVWTDAGVLGRYYAGAGAIAWASLALAAWALL